MYVGLQIRFQIDSIVRPKTKALLLHQQPGVVKQEV